MLGHISFIIEQSSFFIRNIELNIYLLESLFEILEASLFLTKTEVLNDLENQFWGLIRDKTVNLLQVILSHTQLN